MASAGSRVVQRYSEGCHRETWVLDAMVARMKGFRRGGRAQHWTAQIHALIHRKYGGQVGCVSVRSHKNFHTHVYRPRQARASKHGSYARDAKSVLRGVSEILTYLYCTILFVTYTSFYV